MQVNLVPLFSELSTEKKKGLSVDAFKIILKDQDHFDLKLVPNGKMWDVKDIATGKPIWYCMNELVLEKGFETNPYKKTSKDGHVSIGLDLHALFVVENVDNILKTCFLESSRGKKVDNLVMTDKTVNSLFRSSLFNNTVKLKVTFESTAIFDKNGTLLNDPDNLLINQDKLHLLLATGTKLILVIEPSFIWCFNKQIGITWTLRQVKLTEDYSLEDEPAEEEADVSWSLL